MRSNGAAKEERAKKEKTRMSRGEKRMRAEKGQSDAEEKEKRRTKVLCDRIFRPH